MGNKLTEKDGARLLLVGLFLVGLTLLWDEISSKKKGDENSKNTITANSSGPHDSSAKINEAGERTIHSKDYHDLVNHHLSLTDRSIQHNKEKVQLENEATASGSGEYDHLTPRFDMDRSGVDLSSDPRGHDLAEKLGRAGVEFGTPKNPEEIINSQLFNEDQERHYTDSYKEQYAQAYIANALRAGYIIKLSKDYKILSVKPVREPTQESTENIFQSNPSGAQ